MTLIPVLVNDPLIEPYTEAPVMTDDGARLIARFYAPEGRRAKGSVLIVPAMGVPQRYYQPFARWLAQEGYVVATFDYRGVGRSRSRPLAQEDATVLTWARGDVTAMVDALALHAPEGPLYWVGHSLGGQILPFVPNHQRAAKMITVGAGSGYWKQNSPKLRRTAWLLWFVVAPTSMRLFGYFPGAALGLVGDLPSGVMAQWRSWCLDPEYAVGVEGEEARQAFARVRLPIVSLSFEDDEFMSLENTESLHGFYTGAARTMRRILPEEEGLKRIGHFGFFRAGREALWRKFVLREFDAEAVATAA